MVEGNFFLVKIPLEFGQYLGWIYGYQVTVCFFEKPNMETLNRRVFPGREPLAEVFIFYGMLNASLYRLGLQIRRYNLRCGPNRSLWYK